METKTYTWEEASSLFEYFCILMANPEMRWFEKVWKGFISDGKASYFNDIEKHWVIARIVTIGTMYLEFGYKAWNESFDFESIVTELKHEEGFFDLVRLGNMADPKMLSEFDDSDLFVEALTDLVDKCRGEVYEQLCKIFGGVSGLFVSLWLCPNDEIKVGEYEENLLDEVLNDNFEANKMMAFEYVNNGMFSID
jgi:hypothetical protein